MCTPALTVAVVFEPSDVSATILVFGPMPLVLELAKVLFTIETLALPTLDKTFVSKSMKVQPAHHQLPSLCCTFADGAVARLP